MSRKEGLAVVEENSTRLRILFSTAVALVFVFLIVSLVFSGDKRPSVKAGASAAEVNLYAYDLLSTDTPESYTDAIAYYEAQIAEASDNQVNFNLRLDLARLYSETGDPDAGVAVLDEISTASLPRDALYFLYATYAGLYNQLGNAEDANAYTKRIQDAKLVEYIEALDNGKVPEDAEDEEVEEDDGYDYNEHEEEEEVEAEEEDGYFEEETII